jgi:GH24 family phage-related lysozyme (muramidase)
MQSNNHITELELEQILLTEGWMQNVPRLASVGGLAAALAFGNAAQAKATKPVNVSNVKHSLPTGKSSSTKGTSDNKSTVSGGSMFDYISQWEGLRTKVYKDHVGNPTIGIGHFLNNSESDRNIIKTLFGGKVNYDDLLSGKQELTKDQVQKLFSVDVKIKEKLASKLIPDYDKLDQGTKNAIINALYRGDLGKKTIGLINAKDWKSASIEYLNHKNVKSGPDQVKRRMKTNAALLYKNSKDSA